MSLPRPVILGCLLLAVTFTLATWMNPRCEAVTQHGDGDGLLKTVLGESRRLFANHFFVKADVYFHSGYYPSIFDHAQRERVDAHHMMEDHGGGKEDPDEEEHEKAMSLGKPRNWIDRFGRHFFPSTHSHLDKGDETREILPWLRLSAELDPTQVDTYIVASYWLRRHMGRIAQAEQFLREGLRANPTSHEILYELGSLYYDNRHQPERARNLWEAALRQWRAQDAAGKSPDPVAEDAILANLAKVEEELGEKTKAIEYLKQEVNLSPSPEAVKSHIRDLEQAAKSGAVK